MNAHLIVAIATLELGFDPVGLSRPQGTMMNTVCVKESFGPPAEHPRGDHGGEIDGACLDRDISANGFKTLPSE